MFDKDELRKIIGDVARKAEKSGEAASIELIIARVKNRLFSTTGECISRYLLTGIVTGQGDRYRQIDLESATRIATQVAECAEIIMRREWLDEHGGG